MQVTDHMFPGGSDWQVCSMRLRVEVLADRLGARLEHWDADGLGPASGFFFRLPSGRIVLFTELEHAVENLGALGPTISVDIAEAASEGLGVVLGDVLEGLCLGDDDLDWRPDDAEQWASSAAGLARFGL